MKLNNETLKSIHRSFASQKAPCAGCGGKFDNVGAFIPKDQAEVHAPAGKLRVYFYPICDWFMCDKEAIARIESMGLKNFHTQH